MPDAGFKEDVFLVATKMVSSKMISTGQATFFECFL